jgi:hypothetical protein
MYTKYKDLLPSCSLKPAVPNRVYKTAMDTYFQEIRITEC